MTLLSPAWLLLLVPLAAALWAWRPPSRFVLLIRAVSVTLVVLALAGLTLRLPSRSGTVVIVADRSSSMPPGSDAKHIQAINLARAAMAGDDQLRVVSFGERVAIEQANAGAEFTGFVNEVGGDASSLGEAVETALGLIPPGRPGRLVLLTDGKRTGRDPTDFVAAAMARNVAIDFRPEDRPQAGDLAIENVDAPSQVSAGESFLLGANVLAPEAGEVAFTLRRGDRVISQGRRAVSSGRNRFVFRDRAVLSGNQEYVLEVSGTARDPVPENNRARMIVGVSGPKPILHVAPEASSGLHRLLRKGGLDVRLMAAGSARWTLEDLSRYSAVILENVPADRLGNAGMETLAAWVKETGGGLLMTGGQNSYGPGGYYKSPLEPILPVTMELRNEHRKLSLAMVVALDRSGSMSLPVGGGRQKMDLANLGTAQVLDLLSPIDEFGCLAVDTEAHVVAPLGKASAKGKAREDILRIQSMGGGIYIYVALTAASEMLLKATAGTKHIILFADANDSVQELDYKGLLEKTGKAGITVSVIGLGKETDQHAELLKDIAKRGKGRVFFTDQAEELPRLFAQDTFVVARNTFLDAKTPVRHLPSLATITEQAMPTPAGLSVNGFNLCYARPEATVGTLTEDEYKAPLASAWRAGAGRVVCYTGEADGKFAGAMARWDRAGDYFTSLARYAAGPANPLRDGMVLEQRTKDGMNRVTLHLDPEARTAFASLPSLRLLRSRPGQPPRAEAGSLRWSGPDALSADLPMGAGETLLVTAQIPGEPKATPLPPVCLPYSPEFKPATRENGLPVLQRLAKATGGVERVELASVWRDLPREAQLIPVGRWLLLAAVLLWLLEVLERRTSLIANLFRRRAAVPSLAEASTKERREA
ncbi:MAG: VWA domain-containing protein, partial [Gemmataceae bacterium]|nr:VWA domain-containing protein [Gemmataceae bacterium]